MRVLVVHQYGPIRVRDVAVGDNESVDDGAVIDGLRFVEYNIG